MIDEMNDPAGPLTEIDHDILALKKLLRPASKTDCTNVIAACQSIRRNLSFIEDWAFQKGKLND
jgi:hypothetical protein